jgi:hypothetical protein
VSGSNSRRSEECSEDVRNVEVVRQSLTRPRGGSRYATGMDTVRVSGGVASTGESPLRHHLIDVNSQVRGSTARRRAALRSLLVINLSSLACAGSLCGLPTASTSGASVECDREHDGREL